MYSYRIKNIKSFIDSGNIVIKPLTIFVGKNSCGKSSLLRFPVLLNQTFTAANESPIVLCGNKLDYGNYEDVVFGRKIEPITFYISYSIDNRSIHNLKSRYELIFGDPKKAKGLPQINVVTLAVTIDKDSRQMIVDNVKILIDDVLSAEFLCKSKEIKICRVVKEDEFVEKEYCFSAERWSYNKFIPNYFIDEVVKQVVDRFGIDVNDSNLFHRDEMHNRKRKNVKLTEKEIQVKQVLESLSYYSAILWYFYYAMNEESMGSTYIGPFRENPDRVYRDSETDNRNVGVHGENVSTILIRDYQKKSELIKKVSAWLHATMGYNLALKDMGSGFYQIMLENDSKIQSNIMDVGYGISQVLPIVTQIMGETNTNRFNFYNIQDDQCVYIEQPEIHLHPAAQAELAILFTQAVFHKRKVVVETHSEHFIRKLQVLIADKNYPFTSDMVKIYYVDKDEQGVASVSEMKMLENGRFEKPWPSGFFDKAHELSMELLEKISNNSTEE